MLNIAVVRVFLLRDREIKIIFTENSFKKPSAGELLVQSITPDIK